MPRDFGNQREWPGPDSLKKRYCYFCAARQFALTRAIRKRSAAGSRKNGRTTNGSVLWAGPNGMKSIAIAGIPVKNADPKAKITNLLEGKVDG
jgi:hypothetical protein